MEAVSAAALVAQTAGAGGCQEGALVATVMVMM